MVALNVPRGTNPELTEAWVYRGKASVISSSMHAEFRGESRPQWHVSISGVRERPKEAMVQRMLRDFGMVGAEEDNHEPGKARHFWILQDSRIGEDASCECKEGETTVVEPDGYKWQRGEAR